MLACLDLRLGKGKARLKLESIRRGMILGVRAIEAYDISKRSLMTLRG